MAQPERHRWALLQFHAQELAQDARKYARTFDVLHDTKTELMVDEVEAIAQRLDYYLANQERQA